jgi:transposase InsO family protein
LHSTSLLFGFVSFLLTELERVRTTPPTTGNMRRFNRLHLQELSPEAKRRLAWLDFYESHGHNASLTCRHFCISRSTFYTWKKRFKRSDLTTLEDRSSRPRRCRQRTWTTAEVLAVQELRALYPTWGKAKLQRLLEKAGKRLSVSRVGRILAYLKRTGKLIEPLRRTSARRRPWKRPYAVRKPREYVPRLPGDLVQIDTVDVRPEPGVVLKQFTAIDVVSRWSVPLLAADATASSARRALDALLARMPFTVRAIQVDGGSEFMGVFEETVQARQLRLFELPPRSPKLNGCVERANRTFREEFYDCTNVRPTVAALGQALRQYEHLYNTVRPHQALAYLTPAEFLETIPAQEALSGTS